jgi:predicted transposase YdaD
MDYHDDPYFKYLSEQKDELLNSEYFDADKLEDGEDETDITPDEARRQERIEIAQRKRENGDTVRDIADEVNMSHTWVVENTTAPSES